MTEKMYSANPKTTERILKKIYEEQLINLDKLPQEEIKKRFSDTQFKNSSKREILNFLKNTQQEYLELKKDRDRFKRKQVDQVLTKDETDQLELLNSLIKKNSEIINVIKNKVEKVEKTTK